MKKYYTRDCPTNMTIAEWLDSQTDWMARAEAFKFKKKTYPWNLKFEIENFDSDLLLADIHEALGIYGQHGWRSKAGESPVYSGFSLAYNPHHQDGLDIHASTFGTYKKDIDQFYGATETYQDHRRDSYYDAYGFNTPTPAGQHKSLGSFLSRAKRTLIRSRLAILDGSEVNSQWRGEIQGWHVDETIFENLRINIPITTTDNYLFELREGEQVHSSHLDVGYAYTWNTRFPHRAFNNSVDITPRIHLVLGYSPWWDYLPEEQAWIKNEHYGKHPFDMILDGDIFEGLKPVESDS